MQAPMITDAEARKRIMPVVLKNLSRHMTDGQDLKMSLDILSEILSTMQEQQKDADGPFEEMGVPKSEIMGVASLLPTILRIIVAVDASKVSTRRSKSRSLCARGEGRPLSAGCGFPMRQEGNESIRGVLAACFMAVVDLMKPEHVRDYLEDIGTGTAPVFMSELLAALMQVGRRACACARTRGPPCSAPRGAHPQLAESSVYPKDWVNMTMVQGRLMCKAITSFTPLLKEMFLQGDDFDRELWYTFFRVVVVICTSKVRRPGAPRHARDLAPVRAHYSLAPGRGQDLDLEGFIGAKRFRLLAKFGDERIALWEYAASMWHALGEHKAAFIPSLVPSILSVSMIPVRKVRLVGR